MMYGVSYIVAEEDMFLGLGVNSDDSVQILVNGAEVWINNIARGGGDPAIPQDQRS